MTGRGIHLISLGCPKNRVDSEAMLGIAARAGYQPVDDPADAEVIVVNTCGFIGPAQRESVDTILEMTEHRRHGSCRQLIVAGCLAQGHGTTLAAEIDEVDHLLGVGDVERLDQVLREGADRWLVGEARGWLPSADSPRVLSSPAPLSAGTAPLRPVSAYVKVAEGCDRACSFCVIPQLRGPQRSRPVDDVLREVERLAAVGVKEISLIAQDTTAYGRDVDHGGRPVHPGEALARLAERAAEVPGIAWVRLLYLYPDVLAEPLIELLAHHPRVVPYVDMPLQHATTAMLRRMRRGHTARQLRAVVNRLQEAIEPLVFRTAFIVGHPGETQEDFDALCEFVRWGDFNRVAVFRYSDEPGTRAHGMAGKISPLVTANRCRRLEAIARRLARRKGREWIGTDVAVLIEGPSDEHPSVLMGRHPCQAPEVDGQIYLSTAEAPTVEVGPGDLVPARITQAEETDFVAVPLPQDTPCAYLG